MLDEEKNQRPENLELAPFPIIPTDQHGHLLTPALPH
jgi:hypothetical protein